MNKKEESKLKIHKGQLGFNGGYPSWKPIKDSLSKGKKSQRAIQSMKSLHQRVEVELEILLEKIKIIRHESRLKEDFQKSDPNDSECSLFKHFI